MQLQMNRQAISSRHATPDRKESFLGERPLSWSMAGLGTQKQWSSTNNHQLRPLIPDNPGHNTIQAERETAKSLVLEALSDPDIQTVIQITRLLEQTVNQA